MMGPPSDAHTHDIEGAVHEQARQIVTAADVEQSGQRHATD